MQKGDAILLKLTAGGTATDAELATLNEDEIGHYANHLHSQGQRLPEWLKNKLSPDRRVIVETGEAGLNHPRQFSIAPEGNPPPAGER